MCWRFGAWWDSRRVTSGNVPPTTWIPQPVPDPISDKKLRIAVEKSPIIGRLFSYLDRSCQRLLTIPQSIWPPCTTAAHWRTRYLPCALFRVSTPTGREQLRPCAPCPANSCGSGLGSANPRRPQGLRPFLTVGPTALPCAGGHPPQRPPPKPVTSRRQRVCDAAAHPPPAPHLSPAADH